MHRHVQNSAHMAHGRSLSGPFRQNVEQAGMAVDDAARQPGFGQKFCGQRGVGGIGGKIAPLELPLFDLRLRIDPGSALHQPTD